MQIAMAARRLYQSAVNREVEIGVPITRAAQDLAKTEVATFRLPGGGPVVRKAAYQSFTRLMADYLGRIPAADRETVGKELSGRLLMLHSQEIEDRARELHAEYRKPAAEQWKNVAKAWESAFRADPHVGLNRQMTTLARCKALLAQYGNAVGKQHLAALQGLLADTSVGNHVEVLRFINWAADMIAKKATK